MLAIIILLPWSYLTCFAAESELTFTEEEKAFITEHPVIRTGIDPTFVPFEFLDKDGEYKGITTDYIKIISEKTGLKFEIVPDLSWPEAYDQAINGSIDVLPSMSKTEERELHFLFSDPYYFSKRVIVTQDSNTTIDGIDDLMGITVAVQRNSSHHSYLLAYPDINLSLYNSVESALTAVANGSEKAFVGNLASTNYIIKSNGLTNLKYIAFEAEKDQALSIAVRKDWPVLVRIINKVLASITEEEKITINNKWIQVDSEVDNGPFIRVLLIIGAFIVIVLMVSFFWIARLKKEVQMRKRFQIDLEKAKEEAEEANNFKSNFMARMSHEIRTPLNAITGMAYLLKKTQISLTQKMYVDRITQASTNMLSIINDILDFSKIEARKVELEITSFDLDQVIQDVVNIISYKIEEQEIGFKLSKDPAIPNWFLGDEKRIAQILLNILNNAAKFTTIGEVSLDIRLVAKENEKYHLSITIKDTGIGMSKEQVDRLFVPFTQGDISINRRFGGTGLGLSIVKNLLDMMDGQVQVYSTLGEGSTFIIHLTLELDKEKEEEYRKNVSVDHFKNVKTLVLEKTGASMNIIDSYLGSFGMDCELTTSQASALNMLVAANGKFAKPFDLLIVDYETPTEGGFHFVETLRENSSIVKMPKIVMLLPMMRDDLFDKLDSYGVDIGIGKPIIPSILFNGILDIFKLKAVVANQSEDVMESIQELNDDSNCVLVVEDNKTNQIIAKSLLEQVRIKVLIASDGKAGVELYRQNQDKIDLILMDLHMPIMNGYEATVEIRKLSSQIPIVAMTADVILGVTEKCEQYGIHHYISKPFDPERFMVTVTSLIAKAKSQKASNSEILDKVVGLKNIGGNQELYADVLKEYYTENMNTASQLSDAIKDKRFSEAISIVHKVKSSSGSIGAKALYDISIRLQKALEDKKEKEITTLHRDFMQMLKNLLETIHNDLK
jgi:signal transduction histidine kinase/DNA-binding response OmpR family regulator